MAASSSGVRHPTMVAEPIVGELNTFNAKIKDLLSYTPTEEEFLKSVEETNKAVTATVAFPAGSLAQQQVETLKSQGATDLTVVVLQEQIRSLRTAMMQFVDGNAVFIKLWFRAGLAFTMPWSLRTRLCGINKYSSRQSS